MALAVDTVDIKSQDRFPKYEIGMAAGGFYLPDYPGADEMKTVVLPLPYFIYRGDILRADREGGFRGRFYRALDFEIDLSFGAGFPTDGESNTARDGMEELDWIGELGPRAKWYLIRGDMAQLELSVPLRYVFSLDFPDSRHRGFVLNPEIVLRHRLVWFPNSRVVASLGFTHATKKMMDYFYTVESHEATASRPAYKAEDGYFGSNLSLFFVKKFVEKKWQLFTGVSMNSYDGAENRNSPLLRDRYTTSYFLGLSVGLYESEEQGYKD